MTLTQCMLHHAEYEAHHDHPFEFGFDNQGQAHLFPQVAGGAVATLGQAQHCRSARPKTSRRSERREMKLYNKSFLSAWSLYSWDRSVPPSLENIKLVFNLQVSKPTDLFTVVLLVFLLSDVFELLVFRPPSCSSCERSEPTWQLLWSSLYNPWGCWLLTLYSSSLDCC